MPRIWRFLRFGLIERYVFRTAFWATVLCTVVLTAVLWITQALRELDLMTAKGQTILMFLTITSLSLPALIAVIAPVSMFIGCLFTLNKLNSDSELIVMSAAGAPPATILKPLLLLGAIMAVLVGYIMIVLMPASFRGMQDLLTKVRADVIANIVKEGQFTTLDRGVVFHYRDRAGEVLQGIFIQDRRDADKVSVYLAERGKTVQIGTGSYLVLEKGSVQRLQEGQADSSIVVFDRYAIDLSDMMSAAEAAYYKPREQTTWQLWNPEVLPAAGVYLGKYRAELHDRLSAPLYPLAMALIAFAAMGTARTTRQGRGLSLAAAILAIAAVRGAGFVASTLVARAPAMIPAIYIVPTLGSFAAFVFIRLGGDLARFDWARLLAPFARFAPRAAATASS